MKNNLTIDVDSDRKDTVIISKPVTVPFPLTNAEAAELVSLDMATLCEALCTLIHVADQTGLKPSAESLRACIKHLTDGFADASYVGQFVCGKTSFTELNTFAGGVASMANNCLPAVELLRSGRWTLEKFERWLKAIIENDAKFLSEVVHEIKVK